MKRENDIQDCNYERDARFGNFTRRDSRSCSLKNRDPGGPVMKMQNKTQLSVVRRSLSSSRMLDMSKTGIVEVVYCRFSMILLAPIRTYQVHNPIQGLEILSHGYRDSCDPVI